MSDFSLILVLQNQNKQKSSMTRQRYKLNLRKSLLLEEYFTWESFFPLHRPGYRQSSRYPVYIMWLSLQRDCGFSVKRLLLWWWQRGGRDKPPNAPSLASSHSAHMELRYHLERDYEAGHSQHGLYLRHRKELWLQYCYEAEQPVGEVPPAARIWV